MNNKKIKTLLENYKSKNKPYNIVNNIKFTRLFSVNNLHLHH